MSNVLELEVPAELDSEDSVETNLEANQEPVGQEAMDEAAEAEQASMSADISPPVAVVEQPTPAAGRELISDGVAAWEQRTQEIEHEISDLTIERATLADRAKSIKKRIDCLAEELADLRQDGPQPIYKTPPAPVPAVCQDQPHGETIIGMSPAAEPVQSDAWRSAPLSDLNLKKNVHEKLTEAGVDTIGQLEDLRAAIALGKKEWPKGIGKAKVTEIEDSVITWLTTHRDSAVFQSAAGSATSSTTIPTAEEWDSWTDAQRAVYLTDRAAAINTGKKNSLAKVLTNDSYWESGYEAAGRSAEIVDCPNFPGEWQDDWIRGFLSRETVDSYESGEDDDQQSSITLADL